MPVVARKLVPANDSAPLEAADPKERRGPFRPGRLVSSRARQSGAQAVAMFRAVDTTVLAALALAGAATALPAPLSQAPVAQAAPFVMALAFTLWALKSLDLYGFGGRKRRVPHLARLVGAFALAGVLTGFGSALLGADAVVLKSVLAGLALSFLTVHALHMTWWGLVQRWRTEGKLTPNVVVVGATRHAERLIRDALERREVNIIGVFDDRLARAPGAVAGVPVLGDTQALLDHRLLPYVDRVVVALDPSARTRVRQVVERLRVLPNEVSLLVDLEDAEGRDAALSKLANAPLAKLSGAPEDERRAFAKRIQDLVIGGVALVLLAPVLAVIALLVRLDSPGPVFFRQRRHGFNNEEIVVWKFRSMRHEAADARAERQVVADDDRVTRLGRFLRKTSLDELPQLLNVLKGEMSLVGPRPHAVGMKTGETESAQLVAEYAWRHRMKPGMTGWAAVNGSRGPLHDAADVRRRVALDVDYIERQSFWLDLWIMLVTVPCLLGDREAIR
ncbi:undecaprenyl-phosphate glucose phosphotransferase [Caulobacter sp. 17J80-11]|uniref:undecaprenyl-phosphate glucose phosphotransferase n=1 Tax=Caulobacter sp. 17J80-11 TaxID=2763502 RepID=UPI001653960D|nr:undecaprenyl-phosphate glucose phosphotransferase [Caulobacter sp. 17J80-11]MBC6981920.1 undecaprenyl-phosphate glucose phosphotransferase [Caulobacter sp. 17J80-11]